MPLSSLQVLDWGSNNTAQKSTRWQAAGPTCRPMSVRLQAASCRYIESTSSVCATRTRSIPGFFYLLGTLAVLKEASLQPKC